MTFENYVIDQNRLCENVKWATSAMSSRGYGSGVGFEEFEKNEKSKSRKMTDFLTPS